MPIRKPGDALWDKIIADNEFLAKKEEYERRLQAMVYEEDYR